MHQGPERLTGFAQLEQAIADVAPGRRPALQARLGRHADACGCGFAAASLALVLAAFALSRTFTTFDLAPLGWIIAAFGAAFVGKLGGLGWSRLALRRLKRELGVHG